MAWSATGQNFTMCEGDYGIKLPITIKDITFAQDDSVLLTIKDKEDGEVILSKEFTNITDNKVYLEFTEEESAKLPVGSYVYILDWTQAGVFLCNIVPSAPLKVVNKA